MRHWPSRNFFAELEPDLGQPHPIEELAHRDPELRRAYRKLRGQTRGFQAQVRNADWIRFQDARVLVQTMEFELAFNLGFEQGLVTGRAESFHHRTSVPKGEMALRNRLLALTTNETLPPDEMAAVLLEHAWALTRQPPPTPPRRERRHKKVDRTRVRPHVPRTSRASTLSASRKRRLR
jgi:hypothetical protein